MYIKQDFGFNDLMNNCWAGAINTLKTIEEHDKENELMEYLETACDDCPSLTYINDLLWFDSDFIFECLGIVLDEEDEEEIDCKNQSCVDCYKYILGECEGF